MVFLICLMALSGSCELFDKCKETEQPEINFELIVYGSVIVKSLDTGENITVDWFERNIDCIVTKYYCDGTARGPFESTYMLNADGTMINLGMGTWSYRMDNEKDYMRIVFFYQGSELGHYHAFYDILAKYDGGPANLQFKIEIEWDTVNNKLYHSKVTLI